MRMQIVRYQSIEVVNGILVISKDVRKYFSLSFTTHPDVADYFDHPTSCAPFNSHPAGLGPHTATRGLASAIWALV